MEKVRNSKLMREVLITCTAFISLPVVYFYLAYLLSLISFIFLIQRKLDGGDSIKARGQRKSLEEGRVQRRRPLISVLSFLWSASDNGRRYTQTNNLPLIPSTMLS